jgi:signal transduction histidine kinase
VLLNLLGNAVKFTPTCGVTLTVTGSGDSIVLMVEDTGPGIRSADRERVFEAFTQLDETATREQGGTGLGLAISKRLVSLLEGTIRVAPREGGGSSFVVTLPYRRGPTT